MTAPATAPVGCQKIHIDVPIAADCSAQELDEEPIRLLLLPGELRGAALGITNAGATTEKPCRLGWRFCLGVVICRVWLGPHLKAVATVLFREIHGLIGMFEQLFLVVTMLGIERYPDARQHA